MLHETKRITTSDGKGFLIIGAIVKKNEKRQNNNRKRDRSLKYKIRTKPFQNTTHCITMGYI